MGEAPKYLLVDTRVLPDVFNKVVYAKRLLAQGKAKNLSEAAKMADLSRSALYKYKDCVHIYNQSVSENIVTFYAVLEDEPGVLSSVISELYRDGGNILTVNQNIPVDGVASVSISMRLNPQYVNEEQLIKSLRGIPGVVDVRMVTSA